jgi:hypothetical protein
MTSRQIIAALVFVWFGPAVSALAQSGPPFVPEFKLLCHPTEPVKDVPPDDPSADPFGDGPWYVNNDRSIWAAWQTLVSDKTGNRIMWIKPPGQELQITGRRLDGQAPPLEVESTRSYVSRGFEPKRLYFPVPGCWEVTATAGEQELVFVAEVKAPQGEGERN